MPDASVMQNPKVVLATAAITALTTLGVSLIGILPMLRGPDKDAIQVLQSKIEALLHPPEGKEPTSAENWSFSGVIQRDGARGGEEDRVEVSLVPASLVTNTDSRGAYTITNVPPGEYTLLMRPADKNPITITVPTETASRSESVKGFTISYTMKKRS